MKKCGDCLGKLEEKEAFTPYGIKYRYYSCRRCGEEIVDMGQLRDAAGKFSMKAGK